MKHDDDDESIKLALSTHFRQPQESAAFQAEEVTRLWLGSFRETNSNTSYVNQTTTALMMSVNCELLF